MDDSNDSDFMASNNLSNQKDSPSEDESLNDHNVDLADEDYIYKEIDDDDDDFGSSSEPELPPSPLDHLSEGKSDDLEENSAISSSDKNERLIKVKCEEDEEEISVGGGVRSNSGSSHRTKRTSGRLRKDGKVPMHAKNLFPGRPRMRRRKFAQNSILNFSDNPVSSKSPPVSNQEIELENSIPISEMKIEQNESLDNIDQSITPTAREEVVSHPTESLSQSSMETTTNVVQSNEKIPAPKKKLNHPGKIKGKLGGRRNKTMEYRKKRGPKGKFKNFSSVPSATFSSSANGNSNVASTGPVVDNDKQDNDGNENKIILCSNNDDFVLTQDVCVMCGSFGIEEESRLVACAQCGQCYHPFCAGIKLTKIILKKGWRCLECTVCEGCGKPTDESRLLLCDDCDISYHTYCLDPPLEEVPQGTWKCKWCVVCVKCNSTSPGHGSQWQENYTLCGPCASQEKCSCCKMNYEENDLIIQCLQCHRWLHSKCDSMFDENECEIASSVGYHCLNCRPHNEPPPHIQARKNGTLKSIFTKKRAEERNDPMLFKKNDNQNGIENASICSKDDGSIVNSSKLLSKYHFVDGMYLSEVGLTMIKSQAVEQPKKTRVKRKNNNSNNIKEETDLESNNKDFEENVENIETDPSKQSEDEKKKRLRRLRLDKMGIGGFFNKQRSRLSSNKDDEETSQENNCETRSTTPDNPDKPRRRRRINKKKSHFQDQYPSYLQEAFFGKDLLDVITSNGTEGKDEFRLSENEEKSDEDDDQKSIGKDQVVELNSYELNQSVKNQNNKNDELNFLDIEDLPLSPDVAFVDMLMNDDRNLDRNVNDDEVLDELAVENDVEKVNDDVDDNKILGEDIMDSGFNLIGNDLDDTVLPQMDSKDVEDLFEGMSNSSLTSQPSVSNQPQLSQIPPPPPVNDYQIIPETCVNEQMISNKPPNIDTLDIPMISTKQEIISSGSTPVTPMSSDSLSSLQQQFSPFDPNPPPMTPNNPYKMNPSVPMHHHPQDSLHHPHHHHHHPGPHPPPQHHQQQHPPPPQQHQPPPPPPPQQQHQQPGGGNPSGYYMPTATEQDTESQTQTSKNFIKWEADEALGNLATISAVLYSNMNYPNLKQEYPAWTDRLKHIQKMWRQLPTEQRQPYLQKARDNRSINKKNQAEMANKMNNANKNNNKIDSGEKVPWNDASSMSSQNGNDLGYNGGAGGGGMMPSESPYQQQHGPPNNKIYSSPSPMGMTHPGQPSQMAMSPSQPPPSLMMNMQSQQQQSMHSPHHHPPMSPAMLSPRMHLYNDNYAQQQQQQQQQHSSVAPVGHNQMNPMMRPAMMQQTPPASFSPNSPNIQGVHSMGSSNSECYQSSPSTPQRPQSTDLKHYAQTTSPYAAGPPRTPFSPNQHIQPGMHSNANDPYSQTNIENVSGNNQTMDMYKVTQHPLSSKPHTPDSSYMNPSMSGSSLPSTPQPPPSSPQLVSQQVPQSPMSDMYVRSPSSCPPRPPVSTTGANNQQIRPTSQSFDESNYQSQRSEIYSQPNTPNPAYSPQYSMSQPNNYNMPQHDNSQMRPNMMGNAGGTPRPNLQMRRAISDPYARQPPTNVVDDNDLHAKQHLRNLLQVQQQQPIQVRRPDSVSVNPCGPPNRPPMWQQQQQQQEPNNFRQPASPALNIIRNRVPLVPNQPGGYPPPQQQQQQQPQAVDQQNFRFSNTDPRMQMGIHRNPPPEMQQRFRPQQQFVRFPQQQQQMPIRQQGPPPQSRIPAQQSQQWSSNVSASSSMVTNQQQPHIPMVQMQQQPNQNSNYPSPQAQQISNINTVRMQQMKSEMIGTNTTTNNDVESIKSQQQQQQHQISSEGGTNTNEVEESPGSLPVELVGDEDLMNFCEDFDILEYTDPELDDDKNVGGHTGKSHIFDEFDEKDILNNDSSKDNNKQQQNESNQMMMDKASSSNDNINVNENDSDKSIEHQHQIGGHHQQSFNPMSYDNNNNSSPQQNQNNNNSGNRMIDPNQTSQQSAINKNDQQSSSSSYFPSNPDGCFMSDDEFERLKNDFLNDSDQPLNPGSSGVGGGGQMNACYQVSQPQQQPLPPPPQMIPSSSHHQMASGSMMSVQNPMNPNSQQSATSSPHHHQVSPYPPPPQQSSCQFNPMTPPPPSPQPQQQKWPPNRMPPYSPNRMQLQRIPMNPGPPPHHSHPLPLPGMVRHMQPGMYGQPPPGNRMIGPNPSMMRPSMGPNVVGGPNENDMYDQSQQQGMSGLLQQQKHLELEVNRLKKRKKSLNAKQRQCRKNQNELNEQDANELIRVTQEVTGLGKQLEQIRKTIRQNNMLQEKRKTAQNTNLPHSPSTQTSPRSVNSPMAVMNSGPGTPIGICPSTPQSPSLTSPSPSSLMQNSPISSLHSPASIMPPSPMTNNPVEMNVPGRPPPQIVQEDNNPFSDVYLQKEKKQTMQQQQQQQQQQSSASMYQTGRPGQMSNKDSMGGPMYQANFPDDNVVLQSQVTGPSSTQQQYYHGPQQQQPQQQQQPPPSPSTPFGGGPPPSMNQMRPSGPNMNFPNTNNYRFQSGGGAATHFSSNQPHPGPSPQQMAYQQQQQIRRPPPPPYPGNTQQQQQQQQQHYNPSRSTYSPNPQQIRMQQQPPPPMRNPQQMEQCGMNQPGPPPPPPPPPPPQMQSHPSMYQNVVNSPQMPPATMQQQQSNDHIQSNQYQTTTPTSSSSSMDPSLMGLVGEAETTMEFHISEPGNGHDNESDPFTFLKETQANANKQFMVNEQQNQPQQPQHHNLHQHHQQQSHQIITHNNNNNNNNNNDRNNNSTITNTIMVVPPPTRPSSSSQMIQQLANNNNNDNFQRHQQQPQQLRIHIEQNQHQQQQNFDSVSFLNNNNNSINSNNSDQLPLRFNNNNNNSSVSCQIMERQLSSDCISDNSEDDASRQDQLNQSAIKQNALLKKLLQNCPSADLKSMNESNQQQQQQHHQQQQVQDSSSSSLVNTSGQDSSLSNDTSEILPSSGGGGGGGAAAAAAAAAVVPNESAISSVENIEQTTVPATTTKDTATTAAATVDEQNIKTQDMSGDNNNNNNDNSNFAEATATAAPVVEKKLSYLDIRRAQLERDPTPPPEDIKPKRKRTVKRKESNKSIDGDQSSSMDGMTIVKTKKRTRKGSQTKGGTGDDSSMDSVCNNEKLISTVMNSLRQLPAVQILEPEVKLNLNVCLPPDALDFNLKKTKLKGCYGNATLTSVIDYYSTYPFGPKKTSPIVTPSNNNNTNQNNKVSYYNEEFGRSVFEMKEYLRERGLKNESLSLYSRDIDSPETVVSASSPETVCYDNPIDEYNRMKFINEDSDDNNNNSENEDRKSPYLTYLPLRPIPIYSSSSQQAANKTDLMIKEHDKENYGSNQQQKSVLMKFNNNKNSNNNSNNTPLRETGNVGITIMINSVQDVRTCMKALAKLLNITTSFSYNIEKSPTSKITEIVEIIDENGNVYCKFCNCLIKKDQKDFKIKQEDENNENNNNNISLEDFDHHHNDFCNKECFKNYSLATNVQEKLLNSGNNGDNDNDDDVFHDNINNNHNHNDDDSVVGETEQQNDDIIENEIASIFDNQEAFQDEHQRRSEVTEASCVTKIEDLDDNPLDVQEKHWKNTRYMYWNNGAFKNENKISNVDEEPIEESYDKLGISLKPAPNCVEQRNCIFCHELGDGISNGPSRLLNMDVDKWVHLNCALWSNEVYEMLNGALMNVDVAYKRAMNSLCVRCSEFGASIKCFKLRCNNSYHFPCAIKEKCIFYTDKTLFCPLHSSKGLLPNAEEMSSFIVKRRVYINRDEQKQIAAMLHQGDNNLMRIGSLIFLNIGQLLPHQLQNFHTHSYIYPIGYKVSRFYWSPRKLEKRCQYICTINESDGWPQFSIEIKEDGYDDEVYTANTPRLAWEKVIDSIVKLREESQTIKVFFDFISGEDLFGLNEPAIIRILESLPGVDTLYDYNFKYGRSPWYELPLAINPSGCARTEPKKRFHFKRPHTLNVSTNPAKSSLQSPLTNTESTSPYVKQFVHSKVSQYRKMKQEWRNNVYLGRSRISGLGLYANRDIEKHTMIIEYIGVVIRNSVSDVNERIHEAHNRGIYMFRLDDHRVIDATLAGGLARYVNHSCDPNCVAECVQIDRENKILIIANRKILKGEELTYDYKFEFEDDQHKIPCLCGAANCRKWMN